MKSPLSNAVLDIVLKKDLVWSEKYGSQHVNHVTKVFEYTTFSKLQNKIKEYFDTVDIYSLVQEYNEKVEHLENKNKIYDLIPYLSERNRVTRLDMEDYSFKLTIQNEDLS